MFYLSLFKQHIAPQFLRLYKRGQHAVRAKQNTTNKTTNTTTNTRVCDVVKGLQRSLLVLVLCIGHGYAAAQISSITLSVNDGVGALPVPTKIAITGVDANNVPGAGVTLPVGTTNDTSTGNGFVRTHDRITYTVGITPVSGQTLSNVWVTLSFPASITEANGVFMLPANAVCSNGSGAAIQKSGTMRRGTKISCLLAQPITSPNTQEFIFLVGGARAGAIVPTPELSVTADQQPAGLSLQRGVPPPLGSVALPNDLTILAVPNWQLKISPTVSGTVILKDSGGPNGEPGAFIGYPVTVFATGSRIGLEPLDYAGVQFNAKISSNAGGQNMRLFNWTPANGQNPINFDAIGSSGATYSAQGVPDMRDGGGAIGFLPGLNRVLGCTSGSFSPAISDSNANVTGGGEFLAGSSTGPASASTTLISGYGGQSNTIRGSTVNLGVCDVQTEVSSGVYSTVVHNDLTTTPAITTPSSSGTGVQANLKFKFNGNRSASSDPAFATGHLNEYYHESGGTDYLYPMYRWGSDLTPANTVPTGSLRYNSGYEVELPSTVASNTWFAATKDIVFWIPKTSFVTGSYTLEIDGSSIAMTGLSGQANPAHVPLSFTKSYTINTTPVTPVTYTEYQNATGGATAPTGERVGTTLGGSGNPYSGINFQLSFGRYYSLRAGLTNANIGEVYPHTLCEKVDNARIKLLKPSDVFPASQFHNEFAFFSIAASNTYFGSGTVASPRSVDLTYARYKIEYGVRGGSNTWSSSFAPYAASSASRLLSVTSSGERLAGQTAYGTLPASDHSTATCDDPGITWYNTAATAAQLPVWQPIYFDATSSAHQYDSSWTGVTSAVRLPPGDIDKVQFIRVTLIKTDGITDTLDTRYPINTGSTNALLFMFPTPRLDYLYPWTTVAAPNGALPETAPAAGGNYRASVALGATPVKTVSSVSPNYIWAKYQHAPTLGAATTTKTAETAVNIVPPLVFLDLAKTNVTAGTQQVLLGSNQTYSIKPSYLSDTDPAAKETLTIYDVMPPRATFLINSGVSLGGAPLAIYTAGSASLGIAATVPTSVPAGSSGVEIVYDQIPNGGGTWLAAAGYTTLKITLFETQYASSLPEIRYSSSMTTLPTDVLAKHVNSACMVSPNNILSNNALYVPSTAIDVMGGSFSGCSAAANATNTLSGFQGLNLSKQATPDVVEPGGMQKFVVNFRSTGYGPGEGPYAPRLVDVLPNNNDNAVSPGPERTTDLTRVPQRFATNAGTFKLRNPNDNLGALPVIVSTTVPGATTQPTAKLLFTKASFANVSAQAGDASNLPNSTSSTVLWCTYNSATGTFTADRGQSSASNTCPDNKSGSDTHAKFADVTAWMLEYDSARTQDPLPSNGIYTVEIYGSSPGTLSQRSSNSVQACTYATQTAPNCALLPYTYANHRMATQGISGVVYKDTNNNGTYASPDTAIGGVQIRLDKLDISGNREPGKSVWVNTISNQYNSTIPVTLGSVFPAPTTTYIAPAGSYDFSCLDNRTTVTDAFATVWNGCTNRHTLYLENGSTGLPNTTAENRLTSTYAGVTVGKYRVVEVQPNGYVSRTVNPGTCGGIVDTVGGLETIRDINVAVGVSCANNHFGETEREISVVLSAGTVAQNAFKKYTIPYTVLVSATGSLDVYKAQVNLNLVRGYTSGTSVPTVAISNLTLASGSCTLNTAFTGFVAASAPTALTMDTAILSGIDTLPAGQSCTITFNATVDYGTNAVPARTCNTPSGITASGVGTYSTVDNATVITGNNYSGCVMAYASGLDIAGVVSTATNIGWAVPNATGATATVIATNLGSLDISNDATTVDTTTRTVNSPTATPLPIVNIKVAKKLKDATATEPNPRVVGRNAYEVTYQFKLANYSTTYPANNVQISDNFSRTFEGGGVAPVISVLSVTKTASPSKAASTCTPVTSPFASVSAASGTGGTFNLLSGSDSFAISTSTSNYETCELEVKIRVDFDATGANITPPMVSVCVVNSIVGIPVLNQSGCNTAVATSKATVNATGIDINNSPSTLLPDQSFASSSSYTSGDWSNNGSSILTTPAASTSTPTPTQLQAQQVRVRKQVGTPTNAINGNSIVHTIPYTLIVANTAASGGATATNVQVTDNLRSTFPITAGANPAITVSGLALTGSSNATACALNTAFNGTTDVKLLTGSFNLAATESCSITFNAVVSYDPISTTPTGNLNNSARASTAVFTNTGATAACTAAQIAAATASTTDCLITSALSNNVSGTPVTADNVAGTTTPVALSAPTLGVARQITSGPLQVASTGVNTVAYDTIVKVKFENLGNTTLNYVQVVDDLGLAFGTNNVTIAITQAPAFAASPASSAVCTATKLNASFNGTTDTKLLQAGSAGTPASALSLAPTEFCELSYTVRATYSSGAAVPTGSLYSQAFASSTSNGPNNGHTNCSVNAANVSCDAPTTNFVTADKSDDGPSTSSINAVSTTFDDSNSFTLSVARIDMTKEVGSAAQVTNLASTIAWEVPYTLRVQNTGAGIAHNVQAIDKLSNAGGAFVTGSPTVSIKTGSYSVTGTASACVATGTPYSSSTGVFTGLTGTGNLSVGESCTITFTAVVTYSETSAGDGDALQKMPTAAQNNTAYASFGGSAANAGGSFNNVTGVYSPPAAALFTDQSTDVTACLGTGCATPTTAQTASVSPVSFTVPVVTSIGAAKRVAAAGITQVAATLPATAFTVPYIVRVENTGNQTLSNVQVVDDLRIPFAGTNATFTISAAPSIASQSATNPCNGALNAAFNGLGSSSGDMKLLTGTSSLPPGAFCEVAFTATVTYSNGAAPANVSNQAWASSTQIGPNPGHTNCTWNVTNVMCDAPASNGTVLAVDQSNSGSDAVVAGNAPTVSSFSGQRVDITKVAGTPSITVNTPASVKVKTPYTIRVKNTGSSSANKVQVIDKLTGAGGAYATANGVVVSNFSVSGAAACAAAASLVTTYNATTTTLVALTGSSNLAVNDMCTISFDAEAEYVETAAGAGDAAIAIPTQMNNSAFASTSSVTNTGGTVDAAGTYAPTATTLATDKSASPAACTVAVCDPDTVQTDSATVSAVAVPKIGAAKRIVGGITQLVSALPQVAFEAEFEIKVENIGNAPVYNVQVVDDLRMGFGTGATFAMSQLPNIVSASGSAAACNTALNAAFNGTTDIKLFNSTTLLTLNKFEYCVLRFKATATYATAALVPTSSVGNQAYASSTPQAAGANAGHTCSIAAGVVSCAAPLNAVSADDSDEGSNTLTTNGAGTRSDKTAMSFPLQKIGVTKRLDGAVTVVQSTPMQLLVDIPYALIVKNTGSVSISNVQVVDKLKGTGGAFASADAVDVLLVTPTPSNSVGVVPPTVLPLGTTPAANCTAATTMFDSNTGVLTALSGNTSLDAGQACEIKFVVRATFNQTAADKDDARSKVGAAAFGNSAYASSATASNTGGSFAGAVYTQDAAALSLDVSTHKASNCVGAACEPVDGDAPAVTNASIVAPALGTVKTLVSSTQTVGNGFTLVFDFGIKNTGNATAYKVRLDDYLPAAFGAGATYSAFTVAVTNVTNGTCTANSGYDGTAVSGLLTGTDSLAAGASCTVRLTVTVDFGTNNIPAGMTNQAYVSAAMDSGSSNAGYSFPGGVVTAPVGATIITDKTDAGSAAQQDPATSNNAATGATGSASATRFDDPTPLSLAAQKIGITKAQVGSVSVVSGPAPVQIRVPMQIVVKNTGVVPATNVQAVDSLLHSFNVASTALDLAVQSNGAKVMLDTANSVAVGSTPLAAQCAVNATPYNSTTAQVTFMSGSAQLEAGTTCVYLFDALVTYADAASVPATANNFAFASTASTANTGGTVAAPVTVGGTPVYTAMAGNLTTDISVSSSAAPIITDAAAGTPTVLNLSVPLLGLAKAKTALTQIGAYAFKVTYSLTLKNNGNVSLSNVQVNDYLLHAFPSPAVVTVPTTPLASAGCTANGSYNGASNSKLLSGTDSLAVGASCTIVFSANVDYVAPANVPASSANVLNSAYASSANGLNGGYAFSATSVTAPSNAVAVDKSDSGTDPVGSNDTEPGATTGINKYQDPTPINFPGLSTVTGRVYIDKNNNRIPETGEAPLGCYLVEVYDTSVSPAAVIPYLRTLTQIDGTYSIPGIAIGSNYALRFTAIHGNAGSCPRLETISSINIAGPVYGVPQNGINGNTNTGNTATIGVVRAELPLIITTAGVTVVDQNLPIDPNGVVYNSITRQPITGATVTLRDNSCSGTVIPTSDLIAGGVNPYVTTADGFYAFIFTNAALSAPRTIAVCVTAPAGGTYVPSLLIAPSGTLTVTPGAGALAVQTQTSAPAVGQLTTFHQLINYATPRDVINNHVPLDPASLPRLVLTKVADRSAVSLGDILTYTVTVKLTNIAAGIPVPSITMRDTLPAGFKLIPSTVTLQMNAGAITPITAASLNVQGYRFEVPIGTMQLSDLATITYKVRVSVGAQLGNGTNTVTADSGVLGSNPRTHKVAVTGGVFTSEGCVAGKVYVDCNNNHVQDQGELGIPGVRIYMEDSTYFVTDREGKYSYCGLNPTTHILKVDNTTLPLRARLTTSSNRNLGAANSLMLDLRTGEFARGDFIESSCTPTLLQEVQKRIGKEDAPTQVVTPQGKGEADAHQTLEGLVPKPVTKPSNTNNATPSRPTGIIPSTDSAAPVVGKGVTP